jgi:hypothetical protein
MNEIKYETCCKCGAVMANQPAAMIYDPATPEIAPKYLCENYVPNPFARLLHATGDASA